MLGRLRMTVRKSLSESHTFIIGPPPPDHAPDGAVTVAEAIGLENLSPLAFRTEHGSQKVGVHLTLPNGVEGFQPHLSAALTMNPDTNQVVLKNTITTWRIAVRLQLHFSR